MSVTTNLVTIINWAKPFLKNQGLDFSNQQPALGTGNMVMQTMVSAPLKWRWNRGTFQFATVVGTCDYPVNLPNFGFLEDQWVDDGGTIHPLTGAHSLPFATGAKGRPTQITAQSEDESGNITFRTKEMPGKVYEINGSYQRKAKLLTSLATDLGPLPDDFSFVFNWGFLAITCLLNNDPRAAIYEKNFIGRLLGLQGGLSDVDKSIFLGLWASNLKTMFNTQTSAQGAAAGRGGS